MTPGQIVALVRDALILAALGFVVWWIWRSGEDRVKVADMAAVQKQLAANATELANWRAQSAQAETQHAADLQTINATLAQHNQPLIVRVPAPAPRPGAVPSPASAACNQPAASGATDARSGGGTTTVDLRPAISGIEARYEAALADCRAALAKWPH